MSAPRPDWRWLANPIHLVSFGVGLGLAPLAPGTFGTLLGFPLAWALRGFADGRPAAAPWLVLLALLALGTWCAGYTARALGGGDPGAVVCDEYLAFAGLLLAVPAEAWTWGWAFLCFRLFDVTKPPPVSWADRSLKGGIGIMVDDLLAAGWAWLLLRVLAALGLPGGPLA